MSDTAQSVEKSSGNNNDAQEKQSSASAVFTVMLNMYDNEVVRGNSIDSKANIFIGAIIAALTIFLPSIPYGEIKQYLNNPNSCKCGMRILLILLTGCLILIGFAFYNLYQTLKVQGYSSPDVDEVSSDKVLNTTANAAQVAIIKHYNKVINKLEKTNDSRAESLRWGIGVTTFAFFGMLAVTITINYIVH